MNRIAYLLADFQGYLFIGISTIIVFLISLYFVVVKKPKQVNIILAILTSLLTVVIILIGGEAYLRYIYDSSDGIGFLKVSQKWHQRHVVFNSNFRRDEEFVTAKDDTEFRIGVIGDSIAFGIGIENPADRFPDLLENRLRTDGYDINIYNLGMSGVSTQDEIKSFHKMEYLNFDLVIWEYFLNDANTATNSANAKITDDVRTRLRNFPLLAFVLDRSYFINFLYWRLSTSYDQTFRQLVAEDLRLYEDSADFAGHAAQIDEFLMYLSTKNIPTIVIMFPLIHSEAIRQSSRPYFDKIKAVFDQRSVSVIDGDALFAPYPVDQLKASHFDQHPGEFAHQLIADTLYIEVLPVLKQDKHD